MTKKIHMGDKVNPAGGVSALCFVKPMPIDLRRATWTNRPEAVTCKACIAATTARIAESKKEVG